MSAHNFANHRFLFATRDTADQTFRAADDVRNAKIELFAVIAFSLIFDTDNLDRSEVFKTSDKHLKLQITVK